MITDAGLKELARLKTLTKLNLDSTALSESAMHTPGLVAFCIHAVTLSLAHFPTPRYSPSVQIIPKVIPMKYLLPELIASLVAGVPAIPAAEPPTATVRPFTIDDFPIQKLSSFKADPFIAAAIKLQAGGKDKAASTLKDLSKISIDDAKWSIIILCRMLFEAKPGSEFRGPFIGIPYLLPPGPRPDRKSYYFGLTVSDGKDWPLLPIEVVDGVPFCAVQYYWGGGYPEPPRDYLEYCLKNCEWRKDRYSPKTAEEKKQALAKLISTRRESKPLTDEEKVALAKRLSTQID